MVDAWEREQEAGKAEGMEGGKEELLWGGNGEHEVVPQVLAGSPLYRSPSLVLLFLGTGCHEEGRKHSWRGGER